MSNERKRLMAEARELRPWLAVVGRRELPLVERMVLARELRRAQPDLGAKKKGRAS